MYAVYWAIMDDRVPIMYVKVDANAHETWTDERERDGRGARVNTTKYTH